jgi:hypothetical protein
MFNAFGVTRLLIDDTQGAPLRDDPGLWSKTASRFVDRIVFL